MLTPLVVEADPTVVPCGIVPGDDGFVLLLMVLAPLDVLLAPLAVFAPLIVPLIGVAPFPGIGLSR